MESSNALATTTTTLTAGSLIGGQPVTFTATVSSGGFRIVPTGQVVFAMNGSPVATVDLNDAGVATYTASNLAVGAYSVIASYSGDTQCAASSTRISVTIIPAQPTFSLPSGKYIGSATVQILESVPGAVIHYTIDGTEATYESPVYNGAPFTFTAGYRVLRAVATASGISSPEVYASYSVVEQTPTPTINPAPGTYAAGQLITITDSLPTASFRYTTDGTTPTVTSPVYPGPFPVTGSGYVRAIAISTGDEPSNVASSYFSVP